jgi:hypothetical protein
MKEEIITYEHVSVRAASLGCTILMPISRHWFRICLEGQRKVWKASIRITVPMP